MKVYSDLIETAKQKVDLVKNSPTASGTEKLLAESLESIIEALDSVERMAVCSF